VKSGAREVVGRRISGVIAKEGKGSPRSQVFLLFDDGTYYEFYSDSPIRGTGGVDRGGYESVLGYLRGPERDPVFAALADPLGQEAADREIALGRIRGHLRRKEVDLRELRVSLEEIAKAGFNWRELYGEAHNARPKEWPEPPRAEAFLSE
jgi:hypothetical protein